MTALTMTLLPEPVAPAISRCGILARSTAWASPATSRPRANVSFDSDAVNSTSSRMRRSGDDVEVLVRDLDADRALARDRRLDPERAGGERHRQVVGRGLDPADLDVRRRLDLVLGDDRAGVAADDPGRDPEARQLLDDDLLVARVGRLVAAGMDRDRRCPRGPSIGGRMYSIRSLVSGESPASVTSSGSRSGPAAATSVARRAPAPRAGANVFDVWRLARDRRRDRPLSSSPHAPVWPGEGAGRRRSCRSSGRPCRSSRPRPRLAAAAASSSSAGVRLSDAAAVAPIQRAVPTTGRVSCRSGIPKPTTTPRSPARPAATNAPGAETRSVSGAARARPTPPAGDAEDLRGADDPDVGDAPGRGG